MAIPEDEEIGSRAEFLARVARFVDTLLERLSKASSGEDADEKETRMLGNVILKVLRIWERALRAGTLRGGSARLHAGKTEVRPHAGAASGPPL